MAFLLTAINGAENVAARMQGAHVENGLHRRTLAVYKPPPGHVVEAQFAGFRWRTSWTVAPAAFLVVLARDCCCKVVRRMRLPLASYS